MQPLSDILQKQIISQGSITFEKYMELALYCPGLGYYERESAPIGSRGDFFTSVSAGPLFGELLAHRFAAWLRPMAESGARWSLVEAGAHDGALAADVLATLRRHHGDLLAHTDYVLMEPSLRRREWQRARLAPFSPRVRWIEGWDELAGGVNGIIFSNELLDAFPVRRLGWGKRERKWFEWGVTCKDGAFDWTRLALGPGADALFPFADAGLTLDPAGLPALLDVLPDGFTFELNPRATAWWRAAAHALRRGVLVAFDYGLPAEELLRPERAAGTLRAYRDHRVSDDLLAAPGEQDLTAHVNFTALQRAGEAEALRPFLFETQEQFLTGVLRDLPSGDDLSSNWTVERRHQWQTLTHPQQLGRSFRVLAQERP